MEKPGGASYERELTEALGIGVKRLVPNVHSKNEHFHTEAGPARPSMFIKVFADGIKYYRSEVAAGEFAIAQGITFPEIFARGVLHNGAGWIAYEWLDIRPFNERDTEALARLGEFVGRLHRNSRGWTHPDLRTMDNLPELARARIERVYSFDANVARRLQLLYDACLSQAIDDDASNMCLLHRDFGFRNAATIPPATVFIYDYEHAAIGPPMLEFAKAWDREFRSPEVRATFLSNYKRTSGFDTSSWDGPMRLARLWAAAGIFPYAARHRDRAFAQQGLQIVHRLEAELLG